MKLIKEVTEEIQVLVEDGPQGKNYFIEGTFLQSNLKNRNGRVYPLEVMLQEVNRYRTEYIDTSRAFGELSHPECIFSEKFDVLTSTGWKPFTELSVGENILTLSGDGFIKENPIEKIINDPYKGHGYEVNCRGMNSSFTPGHRFLVQDRHGKKEMVTIEEIYNNRKKYNKHSVLKTGKWSGNNPEFITLSGIDPTTIKRMVNRKNNIVEDLNIKTEIFVQFLGIWLAEGHTAPNDKIVISQNIGEKADKIEEMLSKFPVKWNKYTYKNRIMFVLIDRRIHNYLKDLGNKYNKYIPHEIKQLDAPLLEELVHWYILGDGRTKNQFQNLFSVSKRLVEDLHECLIKSGGCGNWTVIETKKDYQFAGRTIKASNKKPLYQLNVSTCPTIYLDDRFTKITKIEHDGNVYCLRVKNGNFYMKQNNKAFWTGNSPSINLERVSHMIKELRQDGNNFVGKAKIMDTPYGKIVKNLMDEGARLGVSSRGLGTLQEKDGVNYVGKDFRLVTAADIVADPSAPDAFVRGIMENKEWVYENGIIKEKDVEEIKVKISNTPSRKLQEVAIREFEKFIRKI